MLSPEEIERYARHIILPEIGGAGQQKLKASRVLVIGAGGLGSPVLQYLAAAGVGTIGVVDDDLVSLSNLQRQIIHASKAIGKPKVDSARETLLRTNPHCEVIPHNVRLTRDTITTITKDYHIIADGCDNFDTRYLLADHCFDCKTPLVSAAVGRFEGTLTTLMPYLTNDAGMPNPSYRCLFPRKPDEGTIPACAQAGILSALTGVLGTLQALEVIKLITGIGEPMIGRLLLFDSLSMRFETIHYKHNSDHPLDRVQQ